MDLSDSAQFGVNLFLLWIGFGILVGMTAQLFLPAGRPQGVFGTLVIGVTGSCIGPLFLSSFEHFQPFNPIGPVGFVISVAVSILLILLYRIGCSILHERQES